VELAAVIAELSQPGAYPVPIASVDVRQTHISVVFLAGPCAYKVKKPVQFGFLDFGTLEKRRFFCEEEVRLNRRLAPDMYLGVVPVTHGAAGLQMEGQGEVVEWAVKMQRLPDDATLEYRLARGEVEDERIRALARKIASFHAQAETGAAIAALGRFEVVAGNARENFAQTASQVGTTIRPNVYDRVRSLTEQALSHLRPLIEKRAAAGIPRDTHGDLRLDHVYLLPERPPPGDLVIIDCIEFSQRFRFGDPIADMAFLVMDLRFHGRRDLADVFTEEYLQAAHDAEGAALLPFYTAYRAAVRGKVEGLKLEEKEIPEEERAVALTRARAHWLLALGELEEPGHRPCLVLVGGLPGSGKSTLAAAVAENADFQVIRSDIVRKELTGVATVSQGASQFEEGIYTPEWNERTYADCLRRAEDLLFDGRRVLIDATFREERNRQKFLDAALRWGVPGLFLLCRAEPELVRQRLFSRRGDASDADWNTYLQSARRWEELSPTTRRHFRPIDTGGNVESVTDQALLVLRGLRLAR
jgi:aminoglycoside phosphotransferase family enzyme/predicted kinase